MEANTVIQYRNNSFIDLKMLFELCGKDFDAIMEIIDMFMNAVPEALQQIKLAYEEKNVESIYIAAHKAKSSLSIIQIKALWDGMHVLENEAREKNWKQEWITIIQQLSTTWQQIQPLLQQWRKDNVPIKAFKAN